MQAKPDNYSKQKSFAKEPIQQSFLDHSETDIENLNQKQTLYPHALFFFGKKCLAKKFAKMYLGVEFYYSLLSFIYSAALLPQVKGNYKELFYLSIMMPGLTSIPITILLLAINYFFQEQCKTSLVKILKFTNVVIMIGSLVRIGVCLGHYSLIFYNLNIRHHSSTWRLIDSLIFAVPYGAGGFLLIRHIVNGFRFFKALNDVKKEMNEITAHSICD